MRGKVPVFDIFKGFPDKDAAWVERVPGLAAARDRMEEIAQKDPNSYFIFNPVSHEILDKHTTFNTPVTHGYTVFRKLDDGGLLKIGWRRDREQAAQLVANLMQHWPAEYFIEPANDNAASVA